MVCCNKHLYKEIKRVEWRMKIFAIPFFSIITGLLITDVPLLLFESLFHIVFSFMSITILWISIRQLVIRAQNYFPNDNQFKKRIVIQIIISILITIVVDIFNLILYNMYHGVNLSLWNCFVETRQHYLAILAFAFLINAVYENLHRFGLLLDKELETENLKKAALEAQYQGLTNKLNPHFLFNSLNTLSELIEEDKLKANRFIQELSDVYRYVLNNSKNVWVSLQVEVDFTKSYFALQKMRFEENLSLEITISSEFLNFYILPQALQMLIENAIKHNEVSNSHKLVISVYIENDFLIIRNNKKLKKNNTTGTQVGLANITERYKILTGKTVEILNEEKRFVVKLPLVKVLEENTAI